MMTWIQGKHTRTAYVLMRHFCATRIQCRWRARGLRNILYVLIARNVSATRLQRAWRLRTQVYQKAKECIANVGNFVTGFNYADAFTLYGPNLAAMFALLRRWRCFDKQTKLWCRLVLQCYLMVFHKSVWAVRLDTQKLGFRAMCTQAEIITELVNKGLLRGKIENLQGQIDRYLELNMKWQRAMNWTNRFSYLSSTYALIYEKEAVPETTTANLIKVCGLTKGENADWVRNVWYVAAEREPVYRLHVGRTVEHARYELEHDPSFCFEDAAILSDERIAEIRNLVPVTFAPKLDKDEEARRSRADKEAGHEKKAKGHAADKALRTQIRLDVGNDKEIRKSAILTRIVRYNYMMQHYFEEKEKLNIQDFITEVLESNAPVWKPWLDRMWPQPYVARVLVPYLEIEAKNQRYEQALLETLFMIEDALMVAVVARDSEEVRSMPAVVLKSTFIENRKEWFRCNIGQENLEGVKIPLPHRFQSLACQRVAKYFACLIGTNNQVTNNAPVWDQIRLAKFTKTFQEILDKTVPRPKKGSRMAEFQNNKLRQTFGLRLSRGLILASLSRHQTVDELVQELSFASEEPAPRSHEAAPGQRPGAGAKGRRQGPDMMTHYIHNFVTFCDIHFRVFGALYATFDT